MRCDVPAREVPTNQTSDPFLSLLPFFRGGLLYIYIYISTTDGDGFSSPFCFCWFWISKLAFCRILSALLVSPRRPNFGNDGAGAYRSIHLSIHPNFFLSLPIPLPSPSPPRSSPPSSLPIRRTIRGSQLFRVSVFLVSSPFFTYNSQPMKRKGKQIPSRRNKISSATKKKK